MLKGVTGRVIFSIAVLMGLSVSVQIAYDQLSYKPYHQKVADTLLRDSFTHIRAAQKLQNRQLTTFAFEYAAWSEFSDLARTDNPVASDYYMILNPSMLNSGVDGVVMLNNAYQTILSLQNHQTIGHGQSTNLGLLPLFKRDQVFVSPDEVKQHGNKYLDRMIMTQSDIGPLLIVAAAVTNSDGVGPSAGTFYLWQRLGEPWLKALGEAAGDQLSAFAVDSEDGQRIAKRFTDEQLFHGVLDDKNLVLAIKDSLTGQPLLFVRFPAPEIVTTVEPPYLLWSVLTIVLSMVLLFVFLRLNILLPLSRLVSHLKSAASGETVHLAQLEESKFKAQWLELAQAYNVMNQRVLSNQEKLLRLNQQLSDLSYQDQLTGIANRRRLDEYLEIAVRRAGNRNEWLTVILSDVDHFKLYNDHYGHPAGDKVLRQVGQALAGQIYPDSDLVARYGGEEFAVVLAGVSPGAAENIMQRLCRTIEALNIPHEHGTEAGVVTLSLGGCCVLSSSDASVKQILSQADQALYQAKQEGRNGWAINQLGGVPAE